MQVVVTGATGHVGANLVPALLERGDRVRALVRGEPIGLDGLDVEIVRGDVRDPEALARAVRGAERVFHLAAVISIDGDPDGSVHATNVIGAGLAAQAALEAGVGRFIHCCSVHAFEEREGGAIDETCPRATSPRRHAYDRSKALGEAEVRKRIADGLDAVIVHPSGVIGPRDLRPSRMGQVLLDLEARRLPALVEGGFNWVDARDLAQGMLAAADRGASGESYILGGAWGAVREVAGIAEQVTGVRRPRLSTPMWLARAALPLIRAYVGLTGRSPLYTAESLAALRFGRHISSEKAGRDLGYRPRPLEETIRDTYAWFEQAGRLRPRGPAPATAARA